MTRPRKQTVDYFPHICKHGKTMFILEQRYGNDGYAFWFKLLELLGSSEGHYLNCNDQTTWEYLQSITRLPSETCTEILNLLSNLDAIHRELWSENIIWSDNFLKQITEVYRNRRVEPPIRPDNYIQKSASGGITTRRKPHSRVEESRGENIPPTPSGGLVCTYCGVNQSEVDWAFDMDHFLPKAAGGTDEEDNLVPTCHVCNQIKQKRIFNTVQEARNHIHNTLWEKNKQRYVGPRKICFGGKPPADWSNGVPKNFNYFWEAYPKKIGKQIALASWLKIKRNGNLPEITKIITAIESQKTWEQWQKDEGQFIPNPATWLNQGRWDDEPPEGGKPEWMKKLSES